MLIRGALPLSLSVSMISLFLACVPLFRTLGLLHPRLRHPSQAPLAFGGAAIPGRERGLVGPGVDEMCSANS